MKSNIFYLSITISIAFSFLYLSNEKPKILIIGDSISIGYTPYVRQVLQDKAIVKHNQGNAQHTGTGLKKIEEWLGDEEWDVVQFNWGLWDLCYRHPDSKTQGKRDKVKGHITFTVDQYATNLDSLVTLLKLKTNAELIFVTTSYVPDNESGRFKDDAIRYNEAAKTIMKKHSIKVNDIYVTSLKIHEEHGKASNDVHYTDAGYKELGNMIADFLEKEIDL